MREDLFRAVLAHTHTRDSVGSYVAYIRRVERLLAIDVDEVPLDVPAIDALHARLLTNGVPARSASNCRSALSSYAEVVRDGFDGGPSKPMRHQIARGARSKVALAMVPNITVTPRPDWMTSASPFDLVKAYGQILSELGSRGIVRTGNAPVGDYAEYLFAKAFGWALAGNSARGHDATDAAGLRYQIKGRRLAGQRASRQIGAIRNIEADPFDHLAAILFDYEFNVAVAAILPLALVRRASSYIAYTNSWRLMLSNDLLADQDVDNVTDAVRDACR